MMDESELMRAQAYVDGELDPPARAAFESRLADDAELHRYVERQRSLRALLGAACAPALDEPVPARLQAGLRPRVVSLDAARARRSWVYWGGLAASVASLALGLAIGRQTMSGGVDAQGVLARGTLAMALDEQLSGQESAGVHLGLSFAAKGGGYCRSFSTTDSAGLACREPAGWRVRELLPAAAPTASSEYRTAASTMPAALLDSIDALRDGEVLDAAGEQAARAKGWRRP